MFNNLKRRGAAIVGAISMLAGCGEDYVYDEEITKALKSHEGEFRLVEVFGDREWTMICHVRDYQRASEALDEFGLPGSFEYEPRDYYMGEDHRGLVLVDANSRNVEVFPFNWREIAHIDGPQCLPRERAAAKFRIRKRTDYDLWSLTFIDLEVGSAAESGD